MSEIESRYERRGWWMPIRVLVGTGAGGLALLLSSCGGSETEAVPATARLIFDDLNVGSQIINVYPGVGDAPSDKVPVGHFPYDTSVEVFCQTTGRTIEEPASVPTVSSDVWYEFRLNGAPAFATDTYAVDTPELAALPPC